MRRLMRIGLPCLFFIQLNVISFAQSGIIGTVAGGGSTESGDGGPATAAQLNNPWGVAVDSAGNLFIAETYNERIRKVTASSSIDFPQVAVGGGWSTSFALNNTGATAISAKLILADSQGSPFAVNSSTMGAGSSFPISIPAGGAFYLTANQMSSSDSIKSGWAKVIAYGGSLDGVATYQSASQGVIQNATGVLASQPTQVATIPVDDSASQSRYTAYAIANPTSQIITVKVALVDSNGAVLDDSASIKLNPGQQIAKYFNQTFTNRPTFKGSIVLRTQGTAAFVAMALVQNQQLFTAIPVILGKAANIPN